MILNGIGSKGSIAKLIYPRFTEHQVYYEPFFRTGKLFFQKPLARYNWLNDLDGDVMNFWMVLMKHREEFEAALETMPMSEELFYHWKENAEASPIMKALRFIMLSNFSLKGKGRTFLLLHSNITTKQRLQGLIDPVHKYISKAIFRNKDFRVFFKGIKCNKLHIPAEERYVYNDPPYLDKPNQYPNCPKWTEQDLRELIVVNQETGIPFSISEQHSPKMKAIAEEYGLFYTKLKEVKNLDNRAVEVLMSSHYVSNYIQQEMNFINAQ